MKISNKILIVAHKSNNLFDFNNLFNKFDAEIIRVNSINEALAVSSEHEFAVAIIDMQISSADCCKILNLIRGAEKFKLLPVIFLTEKYSEQYYSIEGVENGIIDFITKPVISGILTSKIKIYIDLYEQKKRLDYETGKYRLLKKALQQSERKFQEIKTKSRESDKLISSFFANLSHGIRTPMNAIMGFSNLMADETLTGKERLEYISYINNSSLELISLIDNMIDIAKIEAGQLKINNEPVHVRNIFMELYRTFQEEIFNKGINKLQLIFANINDKENIIIKNDDSRLSQVMKNLLNNAVRFTEHGLIEFGYELRNKSKIRFYVKDTGIGIPEDKINIIFNRFERVVNEYYTNMPGTGLGLSVVKKIVELMGGNIWVKSKVGAGSDFYFELPYKRVEYDHLKYKKQLNIDPTKVYNWKDKTVLIAEDEYINFLYLNELLERTGTKIIWAKNGREAISFATQQNVDLILMDIKMPLMSGIEAFYKIKECKPDVPIIAQTAYAMSRERERCFKIGFDDYLVKPIKSSDLMHTIYRFFSFKKVH